MKRYVWLRWLALLPPFAGVARGEVILQYFGTSWNEIERRIPELAERGYDSLWLPPPFEDVGYEDNGVIVGAGNGRFDFKDLNGNGQHDVGEPSEPFEDTGVDPTVPWRRTAQCGYGDGIDHMGNRNSLAVFGVL